MSRKRKGLIWALSISLFLLVNHVVAWAITPAIFGAVFASEKWDPSITAGLVDYQDVVSLYPRKSFFFSSNGASLQGYFYDNPASDKLVVFSCGIDSPADAYLSQELYLYDQGYDVVSYDGYGKGNSGGASRRGIPEAKEDLASLLDYLQTSAYANEPLYLVGHSQGAYASGAILNERASSIKAVAMVSGFDNAEETVMEFARRKVSFLADLSWPYVTTYERYLFGEDSLLRASEGIRKATCPCLIAQGDNDQTIPLNSLSIYSHTSARENPQAKFSLYSGVFSGHTSILYSESANLYQQEVKNDYAALQSQHGGSLTYEEKKAFFDQVDDRKYSESNPQLMKEITTLFSGA